MWLVVRPTAAPIMIELCWLITCLLPPSLRVSLCCTYWVKQPECIRIHLRELSQQKYGEIQVVSAPPFWPTVPDTPKKQAFSTFFDPPQLHERDATEPKIRPNVYLAKALPR